MSIVSDSLDRQLSLLKCTDCWLSRDSYWLHRATAETPPDHNHFLYPVGYM